MSIPLQITCRNMDASESIENHVRIRAAKLESFCERITNCRVIIEEPHRRHHKGKAFQVRIELSVPGREIVINHAPTRLSAAQSAEARESGMVENHRPSKHAAHANVYVAIRDAFNAAGRKLQDYVRRQSGAVKVHEQAARAQASEPWGGYDDRSRL